MTNTHPSFRWLTRMGMVLVLLGAGAVFTGALAKAAAPAAPRLAHQTAVSAVAHQIFVTYTLGGIITPDTGLHEEGSTAVFTITPDTGYQTLDVRVDGTSVGTPTQYTFTNITAPHFITATFGPATYAILPVAGPGGDIWPAATQHVPYGESITFTIVPTTGYHIGDVWVDGIPQGAIELYTFTNVTSTHFITAAFAINTYTLTPTTAAGGRVWPATPQVVTHGQSLAFTFLPEAGYRVAEVVADGVAVGNPSAYTFTNIITHHTLAASFALSVSLQVLSGTQPMSNALIYRLPAAALTGAMPLTAANGLLLRTDTQGYLPGVPRVLPGDQLVALAPISATAAYTLYHTSARVTPTGLDFATVLTAGTYPLTVVAANPLYVFPITVSVEWDARRDTGWLNALTERLARASALLYDATDGQVALGPVQVYVAKEHWPEADLRIAATNALRPNAHQGGVVRTVTLDPDRPSQVYSPGTVRMGASWASTGVSGVPGLGEAWHQALAHELGHFLLYLDDDYLSVDAQGQLTLTESVACTDTLMADAYAATELRRPDNWLPACADTPAQYFTGRSDWATAQRLYPALAVPTAENPGPTTLPLALLPVTLHTPVTPTTAFTDTLFYLRFQNQAQPIGPATRAFLQRGQQFTELGQVLFWGNGAALLAAPGAQPGDRLCVYDLRVGEAAEPPSWGGCKTLLAADDHLLTVTTFSAWHPDINLKFTEPATQLLVEAGHISPGLSLQASLFYEDFGVQTRPLTATPNGTYQTVFTVTEATVEGTVLVWVSDDANPNTQRAAWVSYGLSGHPSNKRRTGRAPAGSTAPTIVGNGMVGVSPDGQVRLYTTHPVSYGAFFNLYAATYISPAYTATVPGGQTFIKHGYWVSASTSAPALDNSGWVVFHYALGDVPGPTLVPQVLYWPAQPNALAPNNTWTPLATTVDAAEGLALTPLVGPGLYVLQTTPCTNCAGLRLWLPYIKR